jgi:DNA-binding NtrC family response regulator
MTAAAQSQPRTGDRPRVLFVDDEHRVLNSMRIMFRRDYDLSFAASGREALELIKHQDVDVIVADHRMPQMTGVQFLAAARSLAPRSVRILLTGYADLNAVEGSINECEVFRFLTKPCPPEQLRDTVAQAARIAQLTPAPAEDDSTGSEIDDESEQSLEIILEADTVLERSTGSAEAEPLAENRHERTARGHPILEQPGAPTTFRPTDTIVLDGAPASKRRLATGLGVIVFSSDEDVINTVQTAVRGRVPVYRSSTIVQVVKLLDEHRPGVLVTDMSTDKATIQAMTARLKQHLPELVTIAVSAHRDVLDMVWLINHGQIFRFLRKPLSPGRCAVSLQAALKHHRMLLKNPALVQRYEVQAAPELGLLGGVLDTLRSVKRLWASM